jgi:hypothetical protein
MTAIAPPSSTVPHRLGGFVLSPAEGFIAGAEYYVGTLSYRVADLYTPPVAKRGYTRDTIRGSASEWDVSRPFSSYARTLAMLATHPFRFFELLPKIPDLRAPALFLIFSGLPAAILWLLFLGPYPALAVLVLPLPLSFLLAGLYHLGVLGGRYGYVVTWRVLAYPLGFYLPFAAVAVLGPLGALYFGLVLMPIGLAKVQEVGGSRSALVCMALSVPIAVGYYLLLAL